MDSGRERDFVFNDESRFSLQHHNGQIRVWRHRGERRVNCCVMHHHTGPAFNIMVWEGIVYFTAYHQVRVSGNLKSYISKLLELVVLPYILRLPSGIFQQNIA
ncbi:transposable element Tcb1 transposase [Trichonephila clavipes]|nr:transposable element Tcb1 transposase [Trichonephila clavipes]